MSVQCIKTKAEIDDFIRFAWDVYRGNEIWIPPIIQDQRKFLSGSLHFFKHCDHRLFVAREGTKIVARIAAFYDENLVKRWNKQIGLIGFFEALGNKDPFVRELFDEAEAFLGSKGAEVVWGPVNGDTDNPCGLLANAYNQSPVFMMGYNPSYYHAYMRRMGYYPMKELVAYTADLMDDRLKRRVSYLLKRAQRSAVHIRPFDMKRFAEESMTLYQIYTATFQNHWGYHTPSKEETVFDVWYSMRPLIDPDFVLFAEYEGKIVGFSISIPDYNPAIKKINGNLDFLGGLTLLRSKKKIREGRLLAIGVLSEMRGQRISPLMVASTYDAMIRKGYIKCEYSWVLRENISSHNVVMKFKNDAYKHYLIYERNLTEEGRKRFLK